MGSGLFSSKNDIGVTQIIQSNRRMTSRDFSPLRIELQRACQQAEFQQKSRRVLVLDIVEQNQVERESPCDLVLTPIHNVDEVLISFVKTLSEFRNLTAQVMQMSAVDMLTENLAGQDRSFLRIGLRKSQPTKEVATVYLGPQLETFFRELLLGLTGVLRSC